MTHTRLHHRVLSTLAAAAALALGGAQTTRAVPVTGQYLEDPRCDVLPTQFLSHELGQFGIFPINEAIEVNFQATTNTVCVAQDGLPNDWNVQIRNVSGVAWRNLFFVVDAGATLGNSDGLISDVINAPTVLTDAMRIDGTVTAGVNNTLFFESGPVDEIFSPGETWRFNVSNFNNIAGGFQPPIINSPGVFAGSSPIGSTQGNASILANPVPEPAIAGAIVLGAAALMLKRPSRNR